MQQSLEPQNPPQSGIKWNEVTWYSKLLAVLLFVVLVCGSFFFGIWYQKQLVPIQTVQNDTLLPDMVHSEVINPVGAVPWVLPTSTDSIYVEKNGKVYVNNPDGQFELPQADTVTFVVPNASIAGAQLAYSYAKDENNVYYRTRIDGSVSTLQNADPSTFVVVQGQVDYDAQDKNHKFFAARIVCEDQTKATCVLEDGPGPGNGRWFQRNWGQSQ